MAEHFQEFASCASPSGWSLSQLPSSCLSGGSLPLLSDGSGCTVAVGGESESIPWVCMAWLFLPKPALLLSNSGRVTVLWPLVCFCGSESATSPILARALVRFWSAFCGGAGQCRSLVDPCPARPFVILTYLLLVLAPKDAVWWHRRRIDLLRLFLSAH